MGLCAKVATQKPGPHFSLCYWAQHSEIDFDLAKMYGERNIS